METVASFVDGGDDFVEQQIVAVVTVVGVDLLLLYGRGVLSGLRRCLRLRTFVAGGDASFFRRFYRFLRFAHVSRLEYAACIRQ